MIKQKRLILGTYKLYWIPVSFLLLNFILPVETNAQNNLSITAGIGFYDLANVGTSWKFTKRSSVSVYAGSNFGLNNKTLWSVGLTFDQIFLKPTNWKVKAGYSVSALYWTQNDDLYKFKNLSFPLMLLLSYDINSFLTIRGESGLNLTSVLESERKQNVRSGYPDRISVNYRLTLQYKLNTR